MVGGWGRRLEDRSQTAILSIALVLVAIVGLLDEATGIELSFSVFYSGPVAFAAWYAGRRAGVGVAVVSCVVWYLVGRLGGEVFSHPAIPIWNALVRFGFFLIIALLVAAVHELLRSEERLARTDDLTGVANSRKFRELLQSELRRSRRSGEPLTIAYLDLDDFKLVNDGCGHEAGDRVLSSLGELLRGGVRSTDAVGRLGGDEFALLLPATDVDGARGVVGKLVERFGSELASEWRIGCSVGVVTFRSAPAAADEAIRIADGLMYEVKRAGKGAIVHALCEHGPDGVVRTARVAGL